MSIVWTRYFWLVKLVGLGMLGALVGTLATELMYTRLPVPFTLEKPAGAEGPNPQVRESFGSESLVDTLSGRRVFGHIPPEPEPEPPEPVPGLVHSPESPTEIQESTLDGVALVATMVLDDPKMSYATVVQDGQSRLVRVGSTVADRAEVVDIARRYVILVEEGVVQVLRIKSGESRRPGNARQKPYTTPPINLSKAEQRPKWKDGIAEVAPGEYRISRAMLDELLDDLGQFGNHARIVPNYENGAYRGFKMVGVRPNSVFRAMGIRSGDIVRGVNGAAIDSPNKALQLFEQFKNSSRVSLDVIRRGQPESLDYSIL